MSIGPPCFETHWYSSDGEIRISELVWSESLVSLAKRFGYSDNGLRKRCKAMNIPTPPKGYWRRVERGWKPRRLPLPRLSG